MRERWIDIALMLGLFLVAGVIVWTLFGAPTPKRLSAPTPQAVAPIQTSDVAAVNPDTPRDLDASRDKVPIVAVAASPNPEPEETRSEAANVEPAATEPITAMAPLPTGTLELNRIGFSYVTGGPGSCGVVLEPWKHVAVSRDILDTYPCGSLVTIRLDKTTAGRDTFSAVVADTMSSVHRLTVNIYVGSNEPALDYGIRDGQLIP